MRKYLVLILLSITIESHGIWTNWAGTQICNPCQIYYPQTVNDLRNYVTDSVLMGHKIRVVGVGYSYSDLVCTDGVLLNLKYLSHILSLDLAKKRVRIEAGITIKELNEQLAAHDLALSNQAATANITLGGALCTAVHGTGHTGTFSNFVAEIELMTADGMIHMISPDTNSTIFNAALVSLGALGIIYAVTLQCESLFFLEAFEEIMDIDSLLENYKELYNSNDFFQFSWEIETNKAIVRRWNRCSADTSKSQECFEALAWYKVDDNDKDFTSEIAVPIDLLPAALNQTKLLIDTYLQNGIKISGDIGIRFVQADRNGFLSPTANQDVAYINISVPLEDKYLKFCKDFEEVMFGFKGFPHWGKMNFIDYKKTFALYGPALTQFIDVKNTLDPQGVFSNDFINRICKVYE